MRDRVEIDGVTYVREFAPSDYFMVRTESAGVFVAMLAADWPDVVQPNGMTELHGARRVWYWSGAATLSELATKGTSKPQDCKFPAGVPFMWVAGVIEVIPVTEEALATFDAVPVWTGHDE